MAHDESGAGRQSQADENGGCAIAGWRLGRLAGRRRVGLVNGRRAAALTGCVLALVLTLAPRAAADDLLDQGARLSALARVWGLLKYFHPGVAEGTVNWDPVLVDELPLV